MTIATYLVAAKMTQEAFDVLTPGEQAKAYNEINQNNIDYIKELEEKSVSKEEMDAAIKAKENETKGQVDRMMTVMATMQEKMLKMGQGTIENGKPATIKSVVSEKFEGIKALQNAAPGSKESVEIKADVSTASITGNVGAFELQTIGQLAVRALPMESLFAKLPVSGNNVNKSIGYYDWDEVTTVRGAAMVAECAVFPESEAKWVYKTLPIQKVGDTIPVCEEFFEDESLFAAELEFFLRTNVAIKVDDQLINGDGLTTNIKGLVASSTTFTPAASGITDASIYDLIVKVKAAITKTGGSKYDPNFVLMNNDDICKMDLKKDANNNYVMPPFVSRDGKTVKSLTVIEDNALTANTLVVGDSRYGKIYEAAGLTMSRGVVDKQFVEDTITLKVRRRLALLIREVDKTGFYHVTDIGAALTTLAL